MKKINLYNTIYFFIYSLLMIIVICKNVDFIIPFINVIHKFIPLVLLLLFFAQNKQISLKSILYILLLVVSFSITYYKTEVSDILYTFLFILSAKNINIRKFIKYDITIKIILILFVFMMYYIGHAQNVQMIRTDGTIRNSLGLAHPNHLGLYLFSICCGIFYLNFYKIKFWNYVVAIFSFLICYYVCDSRASQFGIIILILLTILLKRKNEFFIKYIHYLPIILFGISMLCAIMYSPNSSLFVSLDSLFSSRIKCASTFLSHYGINLFGHFFEYYGKWGSGNSLTVLDNSYIHNLIHYGLIYFIIITGIYIIILKSAAKENKREILVFLIPFLIYGLMERHIIEIQYNTILIYASSVIYFKNKTLK